jgi:hypothetical protein
MRSGIRLAVAVKCKIRRYSTCNLQFVQLGCFPPWQGQTHFVKYQSSILREVLGAVEVASSLTVSCCARCRDHLHSTRHLVTSQMIGNDDTRSPSDRANAPPRGCSTRLMSRRPVLCDARGSGHHLGPVHIELCRSSILRPTTGRSTIWHEYYVSFSTTVHAGRIV